MASSTNSEGKKECTRFSGKKDSTLKNCVSLALHAARLNLWWPEFDRTPELTSYTVTEFKNGDIVRYVGMVQDMLNVEFFYAPSFMDIPVSEETLMHRETFRGILRRQERELRTFYGGPCRERLALFCIPVPGTTPWVENCIRNKNLSRNSAVRSAQRNQRYNGRPEGNGPDQQSSGLSGGEPMRGQVPNTYEPGPSFERGRGMSYGRYNSVPPMEMPQRDRNMNYPYPGQQRTGLPCLLKLRDEEQRFGIMLNDKIEVIGVLNLNDGLYERRGDVLFTNMRQPLVPRIHVVRWRRLCYINPLLDCRLRTGELVAENLRKDLHIILTRIFFGDELAADYVICHLVSRVYQITARGFYGNFGCNLYNLPSGSYALRVYILLEALLTHCLYIPITADVLNQQSFVSKKDYQSNRLWRGLLQLSNDTHIILDETNTREGRLNRTGCQNLSALNFVIRHQMVFYDFLYYAVRYPIHTPILSLSQEPSIFEADYTIKVIPALELTSMGAMDESFNWASHYLRQELADMLRKYLTIMKYSTLQVTHAMRIKMNKDINRLGLGGDPISIKRVVTLAHLLGISNDRKYMTRRDWSRALEMERLRNGRL